MRGGEERLGPYVYRWTAHCFPLSADSLNLGSFCTLKAGDRVLDLGCGAGLLLLLCARREVGETLTLTGVEVDPEAVRAARMNLSENGITGEILSGDVRKLSFTEGQNLVISNPPWYPQGAGKQGGPGRTERMTLLELCETAARILRPGGRFALVHRPDRLTDLLCGLRSAGLEPKRMQLCSSTPSKAPYGVLVEAVKGGRPGLTLLPQWNENGGC